MKNKIKEINEIINSSPWMDIYIYKYEKDHLILAASEDFCYYHNLEIHFKNVYAMEINNWFKIDTQRQFLEITELDTEVGGYLVQKFLIEKGHTIFQMISEDDEYFYIVAKDIDYSNQLVKYYE
ncbi:hypothetical protein GCM10027037_15700 [Mucilaginibacter koreensis]